MLDALFDRLVVAVFAFDFEETGDLAHPPYSLLRSPDASLSAALRASLSAVIAGLDPATHLLAKSLFL